jgi:hypothetical protein
MKKLQRIMKKLNKKYIYFGIILFLFIAIVSATIILDSKNKSINNLGNPSGCAFIQKEISVKDCNVLQNTTKGYVLKIENSLNENCNQDWELNLSCKGNNLLIEIPKDNESILTLLELENKNYFSGAGTSILSEKTGIENIENYFKQESFSLYEKLKNCKTEINYLYTEYGDYGKIANEGLINELNIKLEENQSSDFYFGHYGDQSIDFKECGKIYFVMFKHGEWDSTRYWAVEMNAETGELLKWEEVTLGINEIDYSKLWWIQ